MGGHRILLLLALIVPSFALAQTWSIQAVDVSNARAGSTSLALDVSGGQSYPLIAYFGAPRNLKAGLFNQNTKIWGLASIDAGGEFSSADLDALGVLHVAYLDGGTGDLKYWRLSGGGGSIQIVDTNAGSVNSIRATATGTPRVSYWRANTGIISTPDRLKLADYNGSGWSPSFADPTPPRGRYNSLTLDGAGNPLVAYYDAGPLAPPDLYSRRLRFAFRNSGNWTYDIIDSVGDPGRFNSLQLFGSPAALPRVSYIAGSSTLRFAQQTIGGVWQLQDVASVGVGISSMTSLAIDQAGNPHIAYFDATKDSAMYASRTGVSTWTVVGVDAVGAGGGYCSLRLDTQFSPNRPIISYYDATSQSVKVAYGGYADIDADGIPDQYDPHPSDPDFNNNGIPDGKEGGVALGASGPGTARLGDEPIFGCGTLAALYAGRPPRNGPPPAADLLVLLGPAAYVLYRRARTRSSARA